VRKGEISRIVVSLAILGAAVFIAADFSEKPGSYSSNTSRVVDGDTLEVEGEFTGTVRLLGVDTPETYSSNSPGEFRLEDTLENRDCLENWGEKATEFAENYTQNKQVKISLDPESDRRGDYGRLLAYIETENSSETLNYLLVEKGLARVYESDFQELDRYRSAEELANEQDLGVWSCG